MRTEGWLIEAATLPLCYAKDGAYRRWVVFTDPDAWRFEDKVSAENVIANRGLIGVSATGHTWVSSTPRNHCRNFGRGCGVLQEGGTCVCTCRSCAK